MGLYDRDYLRDEGGPGLSFGGGHRSMVTNLIIVNVAVFVIDALFNGRLTQWFALEGDALWRPWELYGLVTYGFLHSVSDMHHIVFNMLGLFFFGREVEAVYGRREFLLQYLAFVIVGGAIWLAVESFHSFGEPFLNSARLIGASGAVTGVLTLFVLNFPHRTILLFAIVPVPAWMCLVLFILQDLYGVSYGTDNVAYIVHLAGAGLAFPYFRLRWRFEDWVPTNLRSLRFRAPKLRVHHEPPTEQDMQRRVDQILAKWSEKGEQSLTREERKTLEDASKRYRNRNA
jgi:membrane associated rhomboid family serine protease